MVLVLVLVALYSLVPRRMYTNLYLAKTDETVLYVIVGRNGFDN